MSETRKRKVHGLEFKAKVGLEALRRRLGNDSIVTALQYSSHRRLPGRWCRLATPENAGKNFSARCW